MSQTWWKNKFNLSDILLVTRFHSVTKFWSTKNCVTNGVSTMRVMPTFYNWNQYLEEKSVLLTSTTRKRALGQHAYPWRWLCRLIRIYNFKISGSRTDTVQSLIRILCAASKKTKHYSQNFIFNFTGCRLRAQKAVNSCWHDSDLRLSLQSFVSMHESQQPVVNLFW